MQNKHLLGVKCSSWYVAIVFTLLLNYSAAAYCYRMIPLIGLALLSNPPRLRSWKHCPPHFSLRDARVSPQRLCNKMKNAFFPSPMTPTYPAVTHARIARKIHAPSNVFTSNRRVHVFVRVCLSSLFSLSPFSPFPSQSLLDSSIHSLS